MGDTSRYATHDRYLGNETLGEGLRRVPGTSSASPRHLFKCLSERGCCCELTKVCSEMGEPDQSARRWRWPTF